MRFRKFLKPYKTRGSSFREHTTTLQGVSHVKLIEPPCTERYARWCERSKFPRLRKFLLLDFFNHLNLQIIKLNLLNKAVLAEPGFIVALKVCDIGIQPNGLA